MAINYRTHFAYRIDMWDADGENIIEHLLGLDHGSCRSIAKSARDAQLLLNLGHHRVRQARLAELREILSDGALP
jgi:hypothetical protein